MMLHSVSQLDLWHGEESRTIGKELVLPSLRRRVRYNGAFGDEGRGVSV